LKRQRFSCVLPFVSHTGSWIFEQAREHLSFGYLAVSVLAVVFFMPAGIVVVVTLVVVVVGDAVVVAVVVVIVVDGVDVVGVYVEAVGSAVGAENLSNLSS